VNTCALCKAEAGPFRMLSSSDEVVCVDHNACRARRIHRERTAAARAEREAYAQARRVAIGLIQRWQG